MVKFLFHMRIRLVSRCDKWTIWCWNLGIKCRDPREKRRADNELRILVHADIFVYFVCLKKKCVNFYCYDLSFFLMVLQFNEHEDVF